MTAVAARFHVASGEKSETISVHAIEQASGALRRPQKYPRGKGANWIEIVGFDLPNEAGAEATIPGK